MNQQYKVQNVTLPNYGHVPGKHLYLQNQPVAESDPEATKIFQIVIQHAHCCHLPLPCLEPIYDTLQTTSSTTSMYSHMPSSSHSMCPTASFSAPTLYIPGIPCPNTKFHFQFLCLSYFSNTSARVSNQVSFHKMRMSAPHPTPSLENEDVSAPT